MPRNSLITITIGIGFVATCCVILTIQSKKPPEPPRRRTNTAVTTPHPIKPEARNDTFVGSAKCAECHQEIFDQYSQTPMGRSMTRVDDADFVESLDKSVVKSGKNRHYVSILEEDPMQVRLIHREVTTNDQGGELTNRQEEIDFILGSGQRGRSYLISREGSLFQSPLGWYSDGSKWGLSPGYDAGSHARFSRKIGDGCLYCHAGRMVEDLAGRDQYREPIFEEPAIGCERCHGPGEQHIQFHSATDMTDSIDPVINPAALTQSQQESICNQCHLLGKSVVPRYGRDFFDFRPGDELHDIFVILARDDEAIDVSAVSQVEQIHSSRCYQESAGRLQCTSCHDPHTTPTAQTRVDFFREKCLSCHEINACSLELSARKEQSLDDSCIDCHMPRLATTDVPHTSMTNHRIPRHANITPSESAKAASSRNELIVFENAASQIPRNAVERAIGITLMTEAWKRQDPYEAARALTHLKESIGGDFRDRIGVLEDIPLLEEAASGYYVLEDLEAAAACWSRVLTLEPNNEAALLGMAKIAEERQELQSLRKYVDSVLQLNPTSEVALTLKTKERHYSGDTTGAIKTAEHLLELAPKSTDMRRWLIEYYQTTGKTSDVRRHQELLNATE